MSPQLTLKSYHQLFYCSSGSHDTDIPLLGANVHSISLSDNTASECIVAVITARAGVILANVILISITWYTLAKGSIFRKLVEAHGSPLILSNILLRNSV